MPPLQNSVYGGVVLPNEFETLVRRGADGLIEPLGAASWSVSPDYRVVRFAIDGKRRFSDGSPLTATDFKRSWEEGLRMRARSNNKSVEDALYSLKGFDDFAKKGTIDGIRVLPGNVLELVFTEPARVPLGYLSGVRYAAYKVVDGRAIGTGPYVMRERRKKLFLAANPYYAGKKPPFKHIEIQEMATEAVPAALASGKVEGALFSEKADIPDGATKEGHIRCVYSQEADHVAIKVNGLPGRLFAKPEYRLALQALVYEKLAAGDVPAMLRRSHFTADPQSFLRFQAGRLPDAEARRLVEAGRRYLPSLVAVSRKRPVYLVYGSDW
ncbi:MAG: hypothetical protein KGL53_08665, partial [Elusimicrobia bacterium]|nr:hypothetical protein [Elusimicrobiota bacterium]